MEDKIYIKTTHDGLWEKNATKGIAIYMIVGVIILFAFIPLLARMEVFLEYTLGVDKSICSKLADFILVVWYLACLTGIVTVCILTNQARNISKSTAFIVRQSQLYVVQLFYTNRQLGTETDRTMIYAPSGSAAEIASLPNNIQVAKDVQAHEKEVRARRNNPASFIEALDDILNLLDQDPGIYYAIPDAERSGMDRFFKTNIQNAAPYTINTPNARYGFLKLNNPRVIEENKRYFVLNFDNENGDLCTAKFTNCFGDIVDDIRKNSL